MPSALLDTNVLVHAVYRKSPLHVAAGELVDRALRERGRYCIAPQNLIEFSAVVTRSRFVDPPLPGQEVRRIAGLLYRSRKLAKIYPRRGTVIRAIEEGSALGITGPAWYDLFLAVTMRDAGVSIVVTENVEDFRKFSFLTAQRIEHAVK
jgi:predicted nucleic acid-binding protein